MGFQTNNSPGKNISFLLLFKYKNINNKENKLIQRYLKLIFINNYTIKLIVYGCNNIFIYFTNQLL